MKIPFRMIQDKISWLNKNIEKDQLVLLESGLARIVEELEENTMRANSSFARVLSLDLLYCFVRHKRWLQVTTFSELLETDVSSSFDLPGKASRSLVKKMKLLCEQILPQKGRPYLFIQAISRRGFFLNFKRISIYRGLLCYYKKSSCRRI